MRRCAAVIVSLLLVAFLVLAFANRGLIRDHFVAATFDASPEVQALTENLDLTQAGERVFLASEPAIGGAEHFTAWCSGVVRSEESHVLGCYKSENIYLFNVTDPRLEGIVEVTAAHELLHAVFARMSPREQQALAKELRSEYEALIVDSPELAERMAVYESLSPTAYANELFAVLGTEEFPLSEKLESRYAGWFNDREGIVDVHQQVFSVFVDLRARATELADELTTLKASIEERNEEYTASVAAYNSKAAEFKDRNGRFEFSDNVAEFDEIRWHLLDWHADLEDELASLRTDTDHYNELREELEGLKQIGAELDASMNSMPAPAIEAPAPSEEIDE